MAGDKTARVLIVVDDLTGAFHTPGAFAERGVPGGFFALYFFFYSEPEDADGDGIDDETGEPIHKRGEYPTVYLALPGWAASAAADIAEGSAWVRAALGDDMVDHYVHAARWEQFEYDRRVTDWEVARGFERA